MDRMFQQAQGLLETPLSVESTLPLSALSPTPQPRRRFEGLEELAASIKEQGVLQPLLVRPTKDGYAIIAGERRYRAAQMVGLSEVPVVILEVDEATASKVALVENLQREDLNPYEETLGILSLLEMRLNKGREEVIGLLHRMRNEAKGRVTHNVMGNSEARVVEETFQALGRLTWESFVQNRLPLLNLPGDLREALEEGSISYTAALELKKLREEAKRKELLEEAKSGLSLRDLKARVREALKRGASPGSWHKEVAARLARLDLEALPLERRKELERHLEAIRRLLQG
nr:ParB/RepB/Spo0J family partition protein [Meiothermus sp. Pnk-1]